jgi:hypothetical protein
MSALKTRVTHADKRGYHGVWPCGPLKAWSVSATCCVSLVTRYYNTASRKTAQKQRTE